MKNHVKKHYMTFSPIGDSIAAENYMSLISMDIQRAFNNVERPDILT